MISEVNQATHLEPKEEQVCESAWCKNQKRFLMCLLDTPVRRV